MNKMIDQMYHCKANNFHFLSVIIVQMIYSFSSKRAMKFKKQNPHLVFLPSSVTSNIHHIRDTKKGHVDLSEFLKRVGQPSYYCKLEFITKNSIHLVGAFPMSTQDPKFMMEVANHFDLVSKCKG